MTKQQYLDRVRETGFVEFPYIISGEEKFLNSLVEFDKVNLELRTHLAEVIICRCCTTTGIYFPDDINSFIQSFLSNLENDLLRPWLTTPIKEAMELILSDDFFSKQILEQPLCSAFSNFTQNIFWVTDL